MLNIGGSVKFFYFFFISPVLILINVMQRLVMDKSTLLKEINSIRDQLIEKYKPEKIILFGSAAWGKGEINDIDLLIIKKDIPYYGADRVTELYHILSVEASVDYIVYKPEEAEERLSLGDPFIKKIFKEGKVLYG